MTTGSGRAGTVYTSLLSLQQRGWINYLISKAGLKQLACETENWERISGVIGRVLRLEG